MYDITKQVACYTGSYALLHIIARSYARLLLSYRNRKLFLHSAIYYLDGNLFFSIGVEKKLSYFYTENVHLLCNHFFAIVLKSTRDTSSLRWNKFLITGIIRRRVWLNRRPLAATIAGCILHPHPASPRGRKLLLGSGGGVERRERERGSMQVERGQNFRSTQGRLNKSRAPTPPASRRNSLDRVRIVVNYKKGGLNCTSNGACTRTPRNNHACVYASVCNTYTRRRCIGIMPSKSQCLVPPRRDLDFDNPKRNNF